MGRRIPTPEGAVLRFYRFSRGLSAAAFGVVVDASADEIERRERGDVQLPREELIGLLAPLGVSPEAIDRALEAHRLGNLPGEPGSPVDPTPEERRLIEGAVDAGGRAGGEAVRAEMENDRRRRHARRHRTWAGGIWSRLAKLPAEQQETVVEVLLGDERSWALAQRLGLASEAAAADRAGEALRLARLAVRLAEAARGPESWRLRLRGWCEPFLANAARVGGDLQASAETFARADQLWERGAAGDPAGLLDGTRRLDLKASLLKDQGKFSEALDLLDRALAASPPREAARLLLKKASTHGRAGDYERALEVLRQAEPRIDASREPRHPFLHRFLLTLNLLHLDFYREAERLLPQVEALTDPLKELDGVRVRWLQGRTWGGLGRRAEALAALSEVRRYFEAEQIPYDFALVSLELAVLRLEQGEAHRAQKLAVEMLWIFESQKVHREALAALGLFCHAAGAGEFQVEGTRRLIKFLYRAQHNPKLRFEP